MNNNNTLFSILIANYNNGKYLIEAIESIKSQSYTNWEIIIVDDCSSDNSKEIYSQISSDDRIQIFYNETNKGCGYTKRRCVELAKGDLCGFLDPDDILLPNALSFMIKTFCNNDKASLVMSRFYYCDEDLNITSESRLLVLNKGESYLTKGDFQPEVFAAFKMSSYKLTDGLSLKYKLGVDQDLYFRLEEVGDIVVLNEFTYKYRRHNNAISKDFPIGLAWNTIVRYEACIRRNLNPELYAFSHFIDGIRKSLEEETINIEINKVRNSKSYKLGKLLLSPFKLIKKII